jgi:hypothetical protein
MKFNPSAVHSCKQEEYGMLKTRATTLQAKMGFQDSDLTTPVHDAMMVWLDQNVEAWIVQRYGAQWDSERVNAVIQEARSTYGKNVDDAWSSVPPPRRIKIESKTWEKPVMARNGFLIGFVDMEVIAQRNVISISGYKWAERWESETYFFEVKPTIPSVGELIRQVRMYQEYRNGKYVVVSPDDRFESILADQQIYFMKADL